MPRSRFREVVPGFVELWGSDYDANVPPCRSRSRPRSALVGCARFQAGLNQTHHRRVGKSRDVSEVTVFGDIAQ